MKKRAQSVLEYVVILGVIGAALVAMQVYFKRSIQAVVKTAADQMGEQKKGLVDYDYRLDWKERGNSDITSTAVGKRTTALATEGAVTYGNDQTTLQSGTLSSGLVHEK